MPANTFDTLKERGLIYQCTDEIAVRDLLTTEKITFYVGFDPTAVSLQIGNLVPIMAMMHLQRAGHRPIVIVGGGTALVGDPSGKTEMRKMLTLAQIEANVIAQKKQFAKYLDFSEHAAIMLNNADWLAKLNYIELLRDIGRHFSINRMLTAESYKIRLETGLSFLEFNYMILQAYDFYMLARDYDCRLQMGGQDQWGNIVQGADLVRRILGKEVNGLTFPLILNAQGQKFGKSVAGAVWLDATKTSPYEYYQFWRNVEDREVAKLLGVFTFLPMDEVQRLSQLPAPLINRAKEILAFEATEITHGREAAINAFTASVNQFGPADPTGAIATSSAIKQIVLTTSPTIPTLKLPRTQFLNGIGVIDLFIKSGLCSSTSEVRRLMTQGGAYVDEQPVSDVTLTIQPDKLNENPLLLRVGKKRYQRIIFE
ncbi:tyrosine--tRNA ligase [candidate division KSB1 bacterium]|nr:tyrosine--tRNA ligase [candidate division KSB1 bacterium]